MQFVMLSSSSLALFTNRKFRPSLNWEKRFSIQNIKSMNSRYLAMSTQIGQIDIPNQYQSKAKPHALYEKRGFVIIICSPLV